MTASKKLLKMKQFKSFCPTHACTIPTAARFFHVSSLQLSAAVNVGHPSSVTVDLTHKSSSSGTFRRVVTYNVCTKLLFRSFVFHSHMSDLLSYLPFVEHWPSAHTTSSSHCSIRIAHIVPWGLLWDRISFDLGSLFCRFLFPNMIDWIHPGWWLSLLSLFGCFVMDARVGGVATSVFHVVFPPRRQRGMFLGPL